MSNEDKYDRMFHYGVTMTTSGGNEVRLFLQVTAARLIILWHVTIDASSLAPLTLQNPHLPQTNMPSESSNTINLFN